MGVFSWQKTLMTFYNEFLGRSCFVNCNVVRHLEQWFNQHSNSDFRLDATVSAALRSTINLQSLGGMGSQSGKLMSCAPPANHTHNTPPNLSTTHHHHHNHDTTPTQQHTSAQTQNQHTRRDRHNPSQVWHVSHRGHPGGDQNNSGQYSHA